ncbi:sugar transferase [Actinoallomurus purpureus]|uniref:sugar transferase n=1 Tax=Actinoallomurus purpureus TaxID=478114 RepID=UPI0027E2658B|nr:sugar transferase [Actinoallomurus purpureus]
MTTVEQADTITLREKSFRLTSRHGWIPPYIRWLVIIDAASAITASTVGLVARFRGAESTPWPDATLGIVLPFIWILSIAAGRAYEPRFFGVGSDEFRRVLNVGLLLSAAVTNLSYVTKAEVARGYALVTLPLMIFLDVTGRYLLRRRLHRLRARGACMRRSVVVGHRSAVTELVCELRRTPFHGLNIVAACVPPGSERDDLDGVPVLGGFDDVVRVIGVCRADTVAVLACPEIDAARLRRLAWQLEKGDTDLFVAPALMDVAGPRTTIRPIAGLPLLHVDHPELTGGRRLVKSLFDRLVAGLALLVLAPALVVIAALLRFTGPALFVQRRIGRDGKVFRMLKFRTMVKNAEKLRPALLGRNDGDGVLFKIKEDPRITRIGAWLRRYSLDELPQLINVLRGDMSLVGPRPPLPEEVSRYESDVYRRLAVKPGLTGLWQVSGRSDLPWDEAVRLDLRYVENWSLTLDMQILGKTLSAVIRGSGAY